MMLSALPRQALRASRVRALQTVSVNCTRYYSTGDSDNTDSNNAAQSGDSNATKNSSPSDSRPQGSEAIFNILTPNPSTSSTATTSAAASSSSEAGASSTASGGVGGRRPAGDSANKGVGVDLILKTLEMAKVRQSSRLSSEKGLLDLDLPKLSANRPFLEDVRTCSHNLHIHASMNNTILTLSDSKGDPVTTQSAGSAGLKKSARSGPEAGYQAMTKLIEKVEEKNIQVESLHVLLKGFGPGRDSAFRAIRAKTNWDIKRISDTTPIPFNGCRPPKARRL